MAMQGYGTYPNDPNLPPELGAVQESLVRRQRIAEAMMQRGMTPIQSSNPRSPVSYTQGLAQLMNAYRGGQEMDAVDKGRGDLGRQYQEGLANEVQRIAALRRGQEIQPDPQEFEQAADQGTPQPRVGSTGDPRAAVQAALTSQYAPVREMGKMDFQADMRTREADQAQAARLHERQLTLEAQATRADLDRESREQAQREANQIKAMIAALAAKSGGQDRSPFFTFLPTPEGYVAGNARTGQVQPVVVDGKRVLRSTDSPNLQGQIAGAKKTGEAKAARAFNMGGIGGVIKQAEDLLSGKVKPTGSGLGSAVDAVAGFFGGSPEGAKEAQSLKAVAGALTAKMPRMEGPQSDQDVKLYRESAAEVGNDKVPVDRRLSALQVVKNLWMKYETQNPDAFQAAGEGGNAVPAGVDPAVWGVMTPEEKALWQN